jgi:heavy metal translocating P-type ATPase
MGSNPIGATMNFSFKKIFQSPTKEYILVAFLVIGLLSDYILGFKNILLIVAVIGAFVPLMKGVLPLLKRKITIDTFNSFSVIVTLVINDFRSAAFIILMLTFAYILDWNLTDRKNKAIDKLMKLKPVKAFIEKDGKIEEIKTEDIKTGDILVVKEGLKIPTDGVVIFGEAQVNQAIITGESMPVKKIIGNEVFGSTTNIDGTIKIKATRVGKDSTIERIAALISEASKHKSRSEKIADRFAKILLPVILVIGAGTYIITHNILYVASLFLVACADDMAVAIPLAITASIGKAAKKGMIIKGGEWLEVLAKVDTIVIDKTGTLTYGDLHVAKTIIKEDFPEKDFWTFVGAAEKLSAHPVGRAIYHEAETNIGSVPDPESFLAIKGVGASAKYNSQEITIGNIDVLSIKKISKNSASYKEIKDLSEKENMPVNVVFIGSKIAGYILVRDVPRAEAKESISKLKNIGIKRITMFTGDTKNMASIIGKELGISDVRPEMKPEDKLVELEKMITKDKKLAMIGDGINDTPALMRADIGIAMGGAGTEVVMETADAIIFTDKLNLLPEMILLGRKTMSVVRGDMVLWGLSNAVGFTLVFLGFINPVLAAFYNFATDFIPLINSGRLFRD